MQPSATPRSISRFRLQVVLAIVAVVIAATVAIAVAVLVWYPTTRQPQITLSNASYVTGTCVPVGSGFGNRYNWTFTLVNTGSADGTASVGFALDGNSVGYRYYVVPQHSQVTENATEYGTIFPSRGACGGPETPSISLASVTGGPVVDTRDVIFSFVGPTGTIGFSAAMLGILQFRARRRGFSIFTDLGVYGWAVALLVVWAAGFFSAVLTSLLVTPYNYPIDWTPAILGGVVFSAVGIAMFGFACHWTMQAGGRATPRTPNER